MYNLRKMANNNQELNAVLKEFGLEQFSSNLVNLGVNTLDDLQYLAVDMITNENFKGINLIQKKKLLKLASTVQTKVEQEEKCQKFVKTIETMKVTLMDRKLVTEEQFEAMKRAEYVKCFGEGTDNSELAGKYLLNGSSVDKNVEPESKRPRVDSALPTLDTIHPKPNAPVVAPLVSSVSNTLPATSISQVSPDIVTSRPISESDNVGELKLQVATGFDEEEVGDEKEATQVRKIQY